MIHVPAVMASVVDRPVMSVDCLFDNWCRATMNYKINGKRLVPNNHIVWRFMVGGSCSEPTDRSPHTVPVTRWPPKLRERPCRDTNQQGWHCL
jgi:hypothetical protein